MAWENCRLILYDQNGNYCNKPCTITISYTESGTPVSRTFVNTSGIVECGYYSTLTNQILITSNYYKTHEVEVSTDFKVATFQLTSTVIEKRVASKLQRQYLSSWLSDKSVTQEINPTNYQFSNNALGSEIDKWSSGVEYNGYIYAAPLNSTQYYKYNITTDTVTLIGNFGTTTNKWSDSILVNGIIYSVPCNSPYILAFDTSNDTYTYINDFGTTENKWTKGVLAPNGKLYFSPGYHESILEFDPGTSNVRLLDNFGETVNIKFSCIISKDLNLYLVPYNYDYVVKFNTSTEASSTIGTFVATDKWSGAVLAPNNVIYCSPSSNSTVLKINTETDGCTEINGFGAGISKWTSVELYREGLYFTPYNSPYFFKLNYLTEQYKYFGYSSDMTKYKGTVLVDDTIYFIPSGTTQSFKYKLGLHKTYLHTKANNNFRTDNSLNIVYWGDYKNNTLGFLPNGLTPPVSVNGIINTSLSSLTLVNSGFYNKSDVTFECELEVGNLSSLSTGYYRVFSKTTIEYEILLYFSSTTGLFKFCLTFVDYVNSGLTRTFTSGYLPYNTKYVLTSYHNQVNSVKNITFVNGVLTFKNTNDGQLKVTNSNIELNPDLIDIKIKRLHIYNGNKYNVPESPLVLGQTYFIPEELKPVVNLVKYPKYSTTGHGVFVTTSNLNSVETSGESITSIDSEI